MKTIKPLLLLTLVTALGVSCQMNEDNKVSENEIPGINLDLMDTTADPANDFFRFVNGKWLDATEIPADRGRWGSFDELRKITSENTLTILEKSIEDKSYEPGSDQAKAVIFYESAMDTTYINKKGIAPLQPELDKIDAIKNLEDLQNYLINSSNIQQNALVGFGAMPGFTDSNFNDAVIGPGASGLPERDYYLKDDESTQKIQVQYKQHVARMFGFLGISEDEAAPIGEEIFRLEKRMAGAQLSKEESRNLELLKNPRSISQIQEMVPEIDWIAYFDGIKVGQIEFINVTQPKYMDELQQILKEESIGVLKNYIKWTVFNKYAGYLNSEIEQANFDFYGKVLNGTEEMRPRTERIIDICNGTIGQALGKLYVDAYFPPEAKEVALEMVNDLKDAFGERIQNVPWMTDTTKQKALEKLTAFNVKIGYPDKWKDYGNLVVKGKDEGGSFVENMMNVNKWTWDEDIEKIGKAVDKSEWFMPPQMVNAYYNPFYNEIVFPAAILQPPFYNYKADAAVNYGGIGAVIGHEMSHGFDDMGSRFDAEGNLKNWWTQNDRSSFNERTALLIEQFDGYAPFEDLHVNGEFTLGENIGDLGGVNIAYDGLKRYITKHGDPGIIDGYTQDQRFFISWGTIWRTKMRDETLRTRINTDPHSPGMYRAVGPISNLKAFYAAFNVEEGDAMYRPEEKQVYIW